MTDNDATTDAVVTRNESAERYELHVDGALVSIADYSTRPDAIVVPHVETDPARRGNGYSTILMEGVVADLRERSLKIVPHCPFARAFVSALPDADDLITT